MGGSYGITGAAGAAALINTKRLRSHCNDAVAGFAKTSHFVESPLDRTVLRLEDHDLHETKKVDSKADPEKNAADIEPVWGTTLMANGFALGGGMGVGMTIGYENVAVQVLGGAAGVISGGAAVWMLKQHEQRLDRIHESYTRQLENIESASTLQIAP